MSTQYQVYDGKEYEISEYTMSEIIASVYDKMEQSGIREGILFLDEINCVSETLAPAMLQFLQFKVFGRHKVPDGWIVVTAGNPPEYNNSVREFDIVTWDRLKRVDVEPDYSVWKEYAVNKGVHPAITTYLDIKNDDFYLVESTVGGKDFVTARGWEDLSAMIKLYEKHGIAVTEQLVVQYLQQNKIAKNFAVYYDLFKKYRADYHIEEILNGKADSSIVQRASNAKFDERLAIVGLLLDVVYARINDFTNEENMLKLLVAALRNVGVASASTDRQGISKTIEQNIADTEKQLAQAKAAGSLSPSEMRSRRLLISSLNELQAAVIKADDISTGAAAFALINTIYTKRVESMRKSADKIRENMDNMFVFAQKAFSDGQETLILVTELTLSANCAIFIGRYGCKEYFARNKELLFYERHKEIIAQIENLDLT